MEVTDRLNKAMDIAEGLKASNILSGNTIYDLCLHISKAQEQLKNQGEKMFDESALKIAYTSGFKHAKACASYQRDETIAAIKRGDLLFSKLKFE